MLPKGRYEGFLGFAPVLSCDLVKANGLCCPFAGFEVSSFRVQAIPGLEVRA